jgi:hypothetical protein
MSLLNIIYLNLINITPLFEKINPSEFAIVINKAYIILVFANRGRSWAPYIRKTCSKGTVETLVDIGYGSW